MTMSGGRSGAPRRVLVVESIRRAPNGKVDYKRIKAQAMATLAGG